MANDPNVGVVELVVHALGPVAQEMMLVGGCAVGLLMTDTARPQVRQTGDVDLVAEIASMADYYQSLTPRLKNCGFVESPHDDHMCRWKKGNLLLDVMPTKVVLPGHAVNRWYEEAFKRTETISLPSGRKMNLISAPLFVATKLESFHDRGGGDYHHHDMEDILNIVDGRSELETELRAMGGEVMEYLIDEIDELLADSSFTDAIEWQFPDGRATIVITRLRSIAGI
jgi:predicted nucleotidyltransferase